MNESELQKIYNYPVYPKGLKMYSDKGFVNVDNGSRGGTHWTTFYVKNKNSFYFDNFGGQPDKIVLNQLPKPIIDHNYKIQDINSKVCGSYCLYFSYLIEKLNYYHIVLKMYFESFSYF